MCRNVCPLRRRCQGSLSCRTNAPGAPGADKSTLVERFIPRVRQAARACMLASRCARVQIGRHPHRSCHAVMAAELATALRDRYALERELGRDGMATVSLARDLKHDRLVAIKVLGAELWAVAGAEQGAAPASLRPRRPGLDQLQSTPN